MATVASETPAGHSLSRGRQWGLLGAFVGLCVVHAAIADWRERHLLMINSSDSLPNWAFVIERGVLPARGDYVFFDPPADPLVRRHFGARPKMFGKIAYGMPGDLIAHEGPIVSINGKPIARMKPRSRFGETLSPGATGIIPAGCYFAGTPHPDGFDSRYAQIGLVCARQIIGTGTPVL